MGTSRSLLYGGSLSTGSLSGGDGSCPGGLCQGDHLPPWTESQKGKKHYVSTTSFAGTKNETRIPKMKIFKYPSLVLLHCTFTMYRPRVDSISQWCSLCKPEMAAPPGHYITLQAINALKETISGLDMRPHRRSTNLLFWKKMPKTAWKWKNLYQEGVCIPSGPPPSLDSACTFTVEIIFSKSKIYHHQNQQEDKHLTPYWRLT